MTPTTVAVSGSGGLVGSALRETLAGTRVIRLARPGFGDGEAALFDPVGGSIDSARLEGCDAVVHLAGEPIASGRWSAARKQKILRSRIEGTRLLVDGLSRLSKRPQVLVSASAVGYYGSRGDETLTESSAPGDGFLADVAKGWEAEAARAASLGVRVVSLRIGIVLSQRGGALARMLIPFRLGVGGRLGDGEQWMPWIHIEDLIGVIRLAMQREDLSGPINAVAPQPARNAEFTRALARALRRPARLPAPGFALRAVLGEMADALLLSSLRVTPNRLTGAGFSWKHPSLDAALQDLVVRR